MAYVFKELPQASLTTKIQYDAEGNIWKNAHGIEKGAYKKVTVPCVSAVANWSDLLSYNSPVGVVSSLFSDVLGMTWNEETAERTLTQETVDFVG